MAKVNFNTALEQYKGQPESKPKDEKGKGHGHCEIYGCPRTGHINTNGIWNCRYHYDQASKDLAQITMKLKNHEDEVDWYERLSTATSADYEVGSVKKDAPRHLKPDIDEDFYAYRFRVAQHIHAVLRP